jgi:hypothetical protein
MNEGLGVVHRSDDGGVTWTAIPPSDPDRLQRNLACNESRAFTVRNTWTGDPDPSVSIFVYDSAGFHGSHTYLNLHLSGIAAAGSTIWAVGHDMSNRGVIVRSTDHGETWSAPLVISTLPLNAVWGASPTDVYVAGFHASLHGDGAIFAPVGIVDGNWFAVWGSSADDVYFAGEFARIAHGRR